MKQDNEKSRPFKANFHQRGTNIPTQKKVPPMPPVKPLKTVTTETNKSNEPKE